MATKKIIGEVSSAIMGYIHGGYKGAYLGRKAYQKLTEKKQMAPVRRRRSADEAGMAPHQSGRRVTIDPPRGGAGYLPPAKRRAKRKRSVYSAKKKTSRKQSKKIKGIVKRVLQCDFNHSTYQKSWSGHLIMVCNTKNKQGVNYHAYLDDGNASASIFNLSFTPFNIKKLQDAASICYNGKAVGFSLEEGTGNFAPKGLQVTFPYCSHKLRLRNITGTIYDMEIIMAQRKNGSLVSAMGEWTNALNTVLWKTESGAGTPDPQTYGMRPQQLPNWMKNYVVKSEKFTLYPGGEKTFFDTWSGCVDFSKHYSANDGQLYTFAAKQGYEMLIIAVPRVNLSHNIDADTMHVGHITGGNDKQAAIVVEVEEFFKIQQPGETEDDKEGNFKALFNYHEANLGVVRQKSLTLKSISDLNGSA